MSRKPVFKIVLVVITGVFLGRCNDSRETSVSTDTTIALNTCPNILLIVADDMAYTDLGSFGGEIPTSTLTHLPIQASACPTFNGPEEDIGWELHGQRALVRGDWKLLSTQNTSKPTWELYNLANDPGERNDLSAEQPGLRDELVAALFAYAEEVDVALD